MDKCKYCGMSFNSDEELQNHMQSAHKSMAKMEANAKQSQSQM